MGRTGIFPASPLPSKAPLPGIRFEEEFDSSHKKKRRGSG
jgi:hypothetical protein